MSFLHDTGNEKALREQGQTLQLKTPTKALGKEVSGDYQAFENVAINCMQFVNQQPAHAFLRVAKSRQQHGVRLSINGRGGRAECVLSNVEQVDDLIYRLEKFKGDMLSKGIVK